MGEEIVTPSIQINKDIVVSNLMISTIILVILMFTVKNIEKYEFTFYALIFFIIVLILKIFTSIHRLLQIDCVRLKNNHLIFLKKNHEMHNVNLSDIGFVVSKNMFSVQDKEWTRFFHLESKKLLFQFETSEINKTSYELFITEICKVSDVNPNDFHSDSLEITPLIKKEK